MYKWLSTSKKGFTLVELLVVIVLLGFGAVALMNLMRVGWRSYNKTDERYAKQEQVKFLAEYLQSATNCGAANSVTIFDTLEVLPTAENADDGYSYIFAVPVDKDNNEKDAAGNLISPTDCAGYRLYILNKGQKRKAARCLNPDIPLYVSVTDKLFPENTNDEAVNAVNRENNKEPHGVKMTIAAMEADASFVAKNMPAPATDVNGQPVAQVNNKGFYEPGDYDSVFFSLDVSYHFPNMVTGKNNIVVNSSSGSFLDEAQTIRVPDTGNSTAGGSVNCASTGCVLRLVVDSVISGDDTQSDMTAPSFCFIATASYGHDSSEVGQLCEFRDKCLMTNPLGKLFVKTYYTISPPIAKLIAKNEVLKAGVRVMLKPLVCVAAYALEPQIFVEAVPYLLLYAASVGGAFFWLHTVRKRKIKAKKANISGDS